jgi:outer membrane protein TolC
MTRSTARATRAALAACVALALAPPAFAQPPAKNRNNQRDAAPPPPPLAPAAPTLSLGECLAIALERSPEVKAAQHSLNATLAGRQALENLPFYAPMLSRDIPVRRLQAERGVTIAAAEVEKVRRDVIYDVTRMYYTYVYAGQQEKTATDVIEQMEVYYQVAKEVVEKGLKGPNLKVDNFTLYALRNRITDVKLLRIKAESGRKQALDALKEAMGVEGSFPYVPRDTELPLMGGSVTKEQVIALALGRRAEIVQAAAGAEAFRLEVCAQEKARGLKVPTLGAGSDLHARQVPMAVRTETDYRPGAISPEMPPGLVGRKEDRVARAWEFSHRQGAVSEQVANLVRLEAATAYLSWEAATRRVDEAKRRYELAQRMLEDSRAAAATRQDPELLFNNEALAGKAQADYVEAVYEHLKALAALERVTAGDVCPAFPGR